MTSVPEQREMEAQKEEAESAAQRRREELLARVCEANKQSRFRPR